MNKFEKMGAGLGSKSNAIARAIEGSDGKYNPNAPRVESKLNKAVDEISKKLNLDKTPETREVLSMKLLKSAIEQIADEFDGILPDKESLSAKYSELILAEALLRRGDVESHGDIVSIVNFLDKKNLLDNSKKGEIIDIVASEFFK